ncbi:MAG: DUF927 domain-containing protein [Desulfovibrionaceae bacterium]|nr:DUF927 domain-containing protein [Desulfovibrionaceae bacterium]
MDVIDVQVKDSAITENIIYAGYSDAEQATRAGKDRKWKEYPATKEGREQAIKDGYTAISCFEFSHSFDERNEPYRFGDMVLDFDVKSEVSDETSPTGSKIIGDVGLALQYVRAFLYHITMKYDIDPEMLRYFASGGKGFHVIIPRELIGSELGHPMLHEIYKEIFDTISRMGHQEIMESPYKDILQRQSGVMNNLFCIDTNFFKGGKGQLLRLPNIRRADSKYKVSVSYNELINNDTQFFLNIVKSQRPYAEYNTSSISVSKKLNEIFTNCLQYIACPSMKGKLGDITTHLTRCTFIKYCEQHPKEVTEEQWFSLACICTNLGRVGMAFFHSISSRDPSRYNRSKANLKLKNAKKYSNITCSSVQKCYQCEMTCGVRSPHELYMKEHSRNININSFEVKDDGLYYIYEGKYGPEATKFSSRIEVIAQCCDAEKANWSKYVEVTNPKGEKQLCLVSYSSLNSESGEEAITTLSDYGLAIDGKKGSKHLVLSYLRATNPTNFATISYKHGWVGKGFAQYLPFDTCNGLIKAILFRKPSEPVYRTTGSLESWQKHVATYCEDNPILQLSIMVALTGPFLALCNHSGFGVHLFGASSSGKTTALEVARSVTGGRMLSWRATDNGLESLAEWHNDGCLLLDEVGQANADVFSTVLYMLANGKGKARADKRGGNRRVASWLLTFLSSGELTSREKISESTRSQMMAGQDVRCIGIHAECGTGHKAFYTVPKDMSDREFADYLKNAAKENSGIIFMDIIHHILKYPDEVKSDIEVLMKEYRDSKDIAALSSQSQRVLEHLALLAAVGEYAIYIKLLPWKKGNAFKAIDFCFEQWIKDNGGKYDIETQQCLDTLLNDCDIENKFRFQDCIKEVSEGGYSYYFIPRWYIETNYCKKHQYTTLVEALKSEDRLILTKNGKVKEQIWEGSSQDRKRGICLKMSKKKDYEQLSDPF